MPYHKYLLSALITVTAGLTGASPATAQQMLPVQKPLASNKVTIKPFLLPTATAGKERFRILPSEQVRVMEEDKLRLYSDDRFSVRALSKKKIRVGLNGTLKF